MKLVEDNHGDISQIKRKYSDFGDRCKELLEYWKTTIEEARWDRVVAVLRAIGLHGPAGILDRAITSLKQRNSSQVDYAHHPIPQAANEAYLEGTYS